MPVPPHPNNLFAAPLAAVILTLSVPAGAAEENVPEGHSNHGEAFNEGPRQAADFMDGQGEVDFPVSTASEEAQAFVNQGVAQLHVFFYFEAERSFRQAATIDPDCAMLYWGMAMANVNNADRAKAFLEVARQKAAEREITRREQLYIDALGAKYAATGNAKSRRQHWLKGLERLVQEFPEDLDARAWLAMVAWRNGRQDGIGSRQAVSMLIDTALERNPTHPGAHHYKIHLWDGHDQTQALESAALFAKAAPGIAHAWHMPGHTYTGLKRYVDAAYQQDGSARVDHAYMTRKRVMPFMIHNYAHNNQWLSESLARIGRAEDAIAVARNLVEQPRDPRKNNERQARSAQRDGRRRWFEALVMFERWDDLIAAVQSEALDWSDEPIEVVQRHYGLGLAAAAQQDLDGLNRRIAALQDLVETETGENGKTTTRKPPRHDETLAELEGHRLWLQGEIDAALERFQDARRMRPAALARLLIEAGRTEEAVAQARKAVSRDKNEVAPLAALVEALHHDGQIDAARAAYLEFQEIAREADADLPLQRRLAAILESWEERDGWRPPDLPERSDLAFQHRVDLDSIGPRLWGPFPAPELDVTDIHGRTHRIEDLEDENLLVIFYLGGACAHCMRQLIIFSEELEAIEATGTRVLAIGTDDVAATRALQENDEVEISMPLAADPDLDLFRRYNAYDDFEDMPLHGTFLIDREGKVRYQDISYEPFFEVEFIIEEAKRVNRPRDAQTPPDTAAAEANAVLFGS